MKYFEPNKRDRKKTKIVATISDRNCSPEFIEKLYHAGMNVVRLNTAHQSPEASLLVVENIRKVSSKIAIMLDTKGPEVRTSKAVDGFEVKTGDIVKFIGDPNRLSDDGVIAISYPGFVTDLSIGAEILIDDGLLSFTVEDKVGDYLVCRAQDNGFIQSRKSVNVPGARLELPSLNEKDRLYIEWAVEHDIDFIAHSFVRRKEDLFAIQEILDKHNSPCRIISKIENLEGVQNIEEILDHCYGVMIARGDLAVEVPRAKIPGIQKRLVKLCIERRKPVIIATQMLHSMMEHPRPTRAEVSDVANAIYDGADDIMLSGETAHGAYPVESVTIMAEIALEVEQDIPVNMSLAPLRLSSDASAHLVKSAVVAINDLNGVAIIADTVSGRTIRNLAGFRSKKPICALCYNERTMREMALSFGVYAYLLSEPQRLTEDFIETSVERLATKYDFHPEDHIALLSGNLGRGVGASALTISRVENLINLPE